MLTWPSKDPDEVLDYELDWADNKRPRLQPGETLIDSKWFVTAGDVMLTREEWVPSGIATVWLTGGSAGTLCTILNRVTTSMGRTYDQSVKLRVRTK